jgi:hypothetical protein
LIFFKKYENFRTKKIFFLFKKISNVTVLLHIKKKKKNKHSLKKMSSTPPEQTTNNSATPIIKRPIEYIEDDIIDVDEQIMSLKKRYFLFFLINFIIILFIIFL